MCSNCSGDYEDPEVTNELDEDLLDASEADPSSKSAAASPAQQEEDAIGNRIKPSNPPLAVRLHGDADSYVRAVFEGFAVRQERLRASNDSRAIQASNVNLVKMVESILRVPR